MSDANHGFVNDERRLKQILVNLISNAIKFTFQGGITISVVQHQTCQELIKISVNDTGVGIPEDLQPRLFRLFGKKYYFY